MAISEHQHQVNLIFWARRLAKQYPELDLLFAIPNGGHRHVSVARKLKAEGVKSGVPDLCLPVARNGFFGLWIEMKGDVGRISPNQKVWIDKLRNEGYRVKVCFGYHDAAKVIADYLGIDNAKL